MSMSSKKTLARTCAFIAIIGLFGLSLRGPERRSSDLSVLMEPDGTGVWHDLFGEFHRVHPELRVDLVEGPAPTDAREDMYSTSFLSEAAGYDIVYGDATWTPKLAAADWLLDLTSRVSPADREDFLPAALQAGSYKGRLYRIPAFTDAGILYYRKDLAPQPPETFDDLKRMANELKTANRAGFLWQGKQYEGLVTVYLEVLRGFGGEWIDQETREVFLDRPEALRALGFLKGAVGGISPAAVTTYGEEETRIPFQNGRAVFLRNWPYVWTLMKDTPLRNQGQVGMAPVVHAPGVESAGTLGGWGFAISRFARNPEAAWQLVDFLTRPEQLRKLQSRMGVIPARRSLTPPEFIPILATARARPSIPEYAQASDILQRWVSAVLSGRVAPERALAEAARETRHLLNAGGS
jgi:trehalose/maltose transport system substrate-binding protein